MTPFRFLKKEVDGIERNELYNDQNNWRVEIIPSLGARINQFEIDLNGKRHSLVAGFKGASGIKGKGVDRFYGIHLFPFPNRIKDGHYTFEGRSYQFPINEVAKNNALHGLVHEVPFTYVDHTIEQEAVTATFQYKSEGRFDGFPFPFLFTVTYILDHSGLHLRITATNTGAKVFPAGYGWHPYFDLGTRIDHLELHMPSTKALAIDDQFIPTGDKEQMDYFMQQHPIGTTALDTCFKVSTTQEKCRTYIKNPETNLAIEVYQKSNEEGLRYVQYYTPETRDCIAVEPMSCPANAFNSGEGIVMLAPRNTHVWECGVKVL